MAYLIRTILARSKTRVTKAPAVMRVAPKHSDSIIRIRWSLPSSKIDFRILRQSRHQAVDDVPALKLKRVLPAEDLPGFADQKRKFQAIGLAFIF
jgi:hypothetical protein